MAHRRRWRAASGYARRAVQVAFVLMFLVLPVAAQQAAVPDNDALKLSTTPRFVIVDGGTLKYAKQLVRLFGINAPEKEQTCDDGKWLPGPLAKKALEGLIDGRPVTCYQVEFDKRNNQPVTRCYAGNDDLQEKMVAAGWAWAFVHDSDRYVETERDAAARKVGVHAHRCMPPWVWRLQQRAARKAR